jgi:very-short-patch-repair endonuclease
MQGKIAPGDRGIATLAARQHGVVSAAQLRALGLGDGAIEYRVRAGRLHRIHRGVFAVGHERLTKFGRWWAAVLAAGEGAVLSHWSAANLWEIGPGGVETAHVAIAGRSGRATRPGLKVHRPRSLEARDRTTHAETGLPVTTPIRTIADLATRTTAADLEQLLEQAHGRHLIDQTTLHGALDDAVPSAARKRIEAILTTGKGLGTARTRSRLERGFLKLTRDHGLSRPLVNQVVIGYEVDFLWPAARLIVETDTETWHGSMIAEATDAHRDSVLEDAGFLVLRFDWNDVFGTPAATARNVRAVLSASR